MSGTPVSKEIHFRVRTDSGTVDGTPTWAAAEDTAPAVTVGSNFRIRVSVQNAGTGSDTITELGSTTATSVGISRCGYAGQTFANLANVINGADASTDVDATNVTVQQLTAGTGSFATGTSGYDENESLSCAVANGNFTEVETGVVLTNGGVGGGETWTAGHGGLTNAADHKITWTTPDTNGSDFQHGTQLGGAAQLVANSASISMTTAAGASSGNLVVVVVSCDNAGTTDGDNSDISSVTIGGTAATKAVEYTNGQGAAQGGATCSIWYLQLSGDLASGSTITANFATSTTSGDANCIQAREFVVASGKTVAVEATNGNATDGASAAALDATTSNIECLRIRGLAIEWGAYSSPYNQVNATSKDWSLWWTSGALYRQTGSASAGNNSLLVEANISTATGASSSLVVNGMAQDSASAYVAFKAVSSFNVAPTMFMVL